MSNTLKNENGATLILVAGSLLVLMGFVALAVDAGLGYDDRRGTQNAADNAALAAAWEACNPAGSPADPAGAALAKAAAQGYANNPPDLTVTPTNLGNGQWQVEISKTNEGIFGVATPFANDEITVVSQAVGSCEETQFLEGKALFAAATTCNPVIELNMSGSDINVTGDVFSNGSLTINTSTPGPSITGDVEYGDPANSNIGSQYEGPLPVDYPLDITILDYRTGSRRSDPNFIEHNGQINNTWMIDEGHATDLGGNAIEITRSGIYYTSGNIRLQNVSAASNVKITLVAEGRIDLNGADLSNMNGYDPVLDGGQVGLLMFADNGGSDPHENPPHGYCSGQDAISVSSATFTNIEGVIFAPHGPVQFSNSDVDLDGSVIAYLIKTSGSSITINYQDDPTFDPEYIIELIR